MQILKFSFLNLVSSKIHFKFAIPKLRNANSGFLISGAVLGCFPDRSFGSDNFSGLILNNVAHLSAELKLFLNGYCIAIKDVS